MLQHFRWLEELTSLYRDMTTQDTRKDRKMDPSLRPVNHGLVSGPEASTQNQQNSSGSPTLSTRPTTCSSDNDAATGSSESEPLSTHVLTGRRSNTREHALLGIGAHSSGTGNIHRAPGVKEANLGTPCPFHGQIERGSTRSPFAGGGLHPMDRYLAEGPLEGSAIVRRPDTGERSVVKRCRCNEDIHHGVVGEESRRG